MLWFHRILFRVEITLKELHLDQVDGLQPARERESLEIDRATFAALLKDCKEFLAVDVIGQSVPKDLIPLNHEGDIFRPDYIMECSHWDAFRRSIRQVRFSKKIPELSRKLQGFTAKLTTFNVQIIQYVES